MSDPIIFDGFRKEETILIRMDKDSEPQKFILREIMGYTRDQWMNLMSKRAKLNSKGEIVGVTSYDGLHSWLISKTMLNEQGEYVTEKWINENLPASLQTALFKKCQEISGLSKEEAEAEKND